MNKQRSRFATLVAVAVSGGVLTLLLVLNMADLNARQQKFTGNENHVIVLDSAVKYIQNFKNNRTAPAINGGYFGKNIFSKILSQTGCVGLRYYYAQKGDGSSTIVLVGVDSTGSDLYQGVLAEEAMPCPPFCLSPNPLNR